jgi:O-antigen/teichoic acid export membrane protein
MFLHETRRLFNNFAFLTGGYFFTRLLTMIATLYATRILGPDSFGSLSFGLNIALVLSVFANLGLDSYLVLAIARNPKEANVLLGDAILVKTVTFPLALLVVLFLSLYDPQSSLLFLIWMVYSLLHSYLILFWAAFRGLERMEFQTILMIVEAILLAVGEIFAAWVTRCATVVAIAYLVSTILAVAGGYALLHKMGFRPEYRWRPSVWKQLLKVSVPFSLIFTYLVVYDRLPSILIALFSGKTAAGWFNSVYNILIVLTTIPSIIVSTVFPYLARKSQENQQSAEEISTNLIKYTAIISLGLAIVFYVLAPLVVPLLFGDAYLPSIWILQVLAIGIPFLFLGMTLTSMIEAVGQQRFAPVMPDMPWR